MVIIQIARVDKISAILIQTFPKIPRYTSVIKGLRDIGLSDKIIIPDRKHDVILICYNRGVILRKFYGNPTSEFNNQRCAKIYDNYIFVVDTYNHRIQIFDYDLNHIMNITEFHIPHSMAVNARIIVVADWGYKQIHIYDRQGTFIRKFGQACIPERNDPDEVKLLNPVSVDIYHDDTIVVADYGHDCVKIFDLYGRFIRKFGKFNDPEGNSYFIKPVLLLLMKNMTIL